MSGRLHIELSRLSGSMPQDRQADADSDAMVDRYIEMDEDGVAIGSSIVCRVSTKQHANVNNLIIDYHWWFEPTNTIL